MRRRAAARWLIAGCVLVSVVHGQETASPGPTAALPATTVATSRGSTAAVSASAAPTSPVSTAAVPATTVATSPGPIPPPVPVASGAPPTPPATAPASPPSPSPSPVATPPEGPAVVVHPRSGLMMKIPAGFREKPQPLWSPVSIYVHDPRETTFQSNINVVLQYHAGSLEDFVQASLASKTGPEVTERIRAADVTVATTTAAVIETRYVARAVPLRNRQVIVPRPGLVTVITGTSMAERFPGFEPTFASILESVRTMERAPHPARLGAVFTDPLGRFSLQPPEGFEPPPPGPEGHGLLLGPWECGDWVRLHAVTVPLEVPDVPQKFRQFFVDRGWAHQTNASPELPVKGRFLRLHKKSAVLMQLEDRHFHPPVARLAIFLPIGSDHALKVYYQLPLPAFPLYQEALEKSLLSFVPKSLPLPAEKK